MLSTPIAHDETLESKLVLQQVVKRVRVLAGVAVVDLVVAAHDARSPCADSICEWPQVELVKCHIINVGADRCCKIVRWRSLTEMLLLVEDVVLAEESR